MASSEVLKLFREAMDATRSRDKPRARELLLRVTQLDPQNESAWQWLAGVAATPLEAVNAYEKALILNPQNEKAKFAIRPTRLQAGIAAAKEKDIPTARRLLRAVVADDSKSELGWLWLASVCESPTEAMAHLKRVLAINPNSKSARKGVEYYEVKIAKGLVGDSGVYRAGGAPTDCPAPESSAQTERPIGRDGPPRALIVDASRTYRKVLALTLAQIGYHSLEAEDAAEAVDRVRDDGVPDLVILDARMSGADPYEFCKLMRQHPDTCRVPVILLSAADMPADKSRAKAAGMTAVVAKPIHPETLVAAVTGTRPFDAPLSA